MKRRFSVDGSLHVWLDIVLWFFACDRIGSVETSTAEDSTFLANEDGRTHIRTAITVEIQKGRSSGHPNIGPSSSAPSGQMGDNRNQEQHQEDNEQYLRNTSRGDRHSCEP